MKENLKFIKNKKIIISLISIIGIICIIGVAILIYKTSSNKNDISIFIVQFESAGGSAIPTQEINKGDKVVKPNDPIKDGFEFVNWLYNDNEFDFETLINENIILIANWKANEDTVIYTVSFDSNGGSSVKSIEVAKGSSITEPILPSKEGYSFKGWYIKDTKYDFNSKIEKDIVLTAKWEKEIGTPDNSNNNAITNNNKTENNVSSNNKTNINNTTNNNQNNNSDINNSKNEENIETNNNVENNNDTEKSKKILDSIKGYYWYLDGYKYAYIRPQVVDWYDWEALQWDSEYIGIKNGKLVTLENLDFDEHINTVNEMSLIQNYLGVNPLSLRIR